MRLVALAPLALAACAAAPAPETAPADPPGFDGRWTLAAIDGAPAATPITLTVAGDLASGIAPCNSYRAAFVVEGAALTVSTLAATRRACPALEREQDYFAALLSARAVRRETGRMTVLDETGAARLSFVRG